MSHVQNLSQEVLDKAIEEAELHEGELTQAATENYIDVCFEKF
jgi:hypothetical protein